jgi:hypothetical protein
MIRRRWKYLGIVALLGALIFVSEIHNFLAVSLPVHGNVLVVESWFWESSAMKEAAEEFRRGQYDRLVSLGAPISRNGGATGQRSSAELAAKRLRELGVDQNVIVVLPVPSVELHQTYASAVTLRNWLNRTKTETTGVNVFTLGTHARKSLVLFTRALGPGFKVGVIAGTEDTYIASRWWLSARGIYVVTRKMLGYLYAVVWPFPDWASA